MAEPTGTQHIHGYCGLCIARCGTVATVEEGRFTRLDPDPSHPTGQALCAKGRAAPELVYHPERLTYPLRRTRPKGDADPGWERISWDTALDLTAAAMRRVTEQHGPQAVAFTLASSSTTAIGDASGFIKQLANAVGTPNAGITMDLCGWGRAFATRYTYGVGSVGIGSGGAMPDIANSGVLILWGYNPSFTRITHATTAVAALKRGMRLIVIDPRHAGLAGKANLWLRVRPGTDGALALGLAHVMIERGWYDRDFIRQWSNGPHLVRADTGRLLTARDLDPHGDAGRTFAWDSAAARLVPYDTTTGQYDGDSASLALDGAYRVATPQGDVVCHPAFELYTRLCRGYPPATVEAICWIPRAQVEAAARLLWQARPVSYYAYSGHEETALPAATVEAFQQSLRGQLIAPNDVRYAEARQVWNANIDRRPGLIYRPVGVADVLNAGRFARDHHLLVSVRSGAHSFPGTCVCNGGLVIDLSLMKGIRVDPVRRTVRAEGGVTWGEFDRETQAFGLATPVGTVSTTGIAGLTLGRGQSWLNSKYGFAIDNLLSVDIVTADGVLRTASGTQHEGLFWGIRGAGHNFGIVTSFEYRLHPVGPVLGGMILYPFNRATEVLRFYREFTASQPDELQTWAGILTGPDGNLVVALIPCYVGSLEAGERLLAPLRRFGSPVADTVAPISYVTMQSMFDAALPPGRLDYWKTGLTDYLADEVIATAVEYAQQVPSPLSVIIFAEFHGAYSRVGKTDTAYYYRDLQYDLIALSVWTDPAETPRNIRWARELFAAWEPHLPRAVYVNDLGDEGEEWAQSAYGENYPRLVTLKATYDPTNVFRLNQNIKPMV